MAHALVAAYSYTLVSPDGKQKTVVKRGQSIDHLDENDQAYLRTKSITPPVVDDSHPVIGRVPLFHPLVDEDVKGAATVEKLSVAPTPGNPYANQAPREQVTVSVAPAAAPAAEAPAAPAAPAAEAPAAPAVPPVPQAPTRRPSE